jgi:lactate 2-monooxygenase
MAPPDGDVEQQTKQSYIEPDPESYTTYQREIYSSLRPPIFSTSPSEWEALARMKVPAPNFGYVYGSASGGRTYQANLEAFDRYRLRPSMLVNATRRDLSVKLFGVKYKSPLLVAPVGVQNIMHRDGEEATARACKKLQIPMILSSAATRTIEQIAEVGGDRWFQLYWPRPQHDDITASILGRAKSNGYKVLVVTLDTFTLGWRPTDLDTSYLPFIWGQGCQIGHSDPIFCKKFAEMAQTHSRSHVQKLEELWTVLQRSGSASGAVQDLGDVDILQKSRVWLEVMNSGTYRDWEDLRILRRLWGSGSIVLKGIQTVADARRASEYGMDGIIVSNHGGRQCDGAIASLDALAEIAADEEVQKSLTILFDSGIRSGSDVLKALALGAKAVCIGRPYMYGLALAGEEGVEHVLKCLLADADNTLGNIGKKSTNELSRHDLQIRS